MNCLKCGSELSIFRCAKCGFDMKNSDIFYFGDTADQGIPMLNKYMQDEERKKQKEAEEVARKQQREREEATQAARGQQETQEVLRQQREAERRCEEILTEAILNKNNKFYHVMGNIPRPVQKLLKMQSVAGRIRADDILFALTVENVVGVQEGIVVLREHILFLSKKTGKILNLSQIKDVKTYINDGGLSIKVMLKDGTIIATGINSTKYNITPIIEFLKKERT